jgi:hypothetical protein
MFKLAIIFVASLAVFSLAPAVAQTDFDILNFALNLECLEAEYYSNAVYGYGLNTTTLGSGPGSTGGLKANLSPELLKIATELANDEINHVSSLLVSTLPYLDFWSPANYFERIYCKYCYCSRNVADTHGVLVDAVRSSHLFAFVQVTDLRSVLGSSAVPCPKMDIGGSFTSLGKAALNVDGFFPYNSDVNFLLGEANVQSCLPTCTTAIQWRLSWEKSHNPTCMASNGPSHASCAGEMSVNMR